MNYVEALLETNKASLGLQDVWMGDQTLLPRTPAACVLPATVNTDYAGAGAGRYMQSVIDVSVLVYHAKIQDTQENELEVVHAAELIASKLSEDATAGGLVLNSLVRSVEPGYVRRKSSWYRSTRVTWQATVRYHL